MRVLSPRLRPFALGAALAAIFAASVGAQRGGLLPLAFTETMELTALDWLFLLRGPQPPAPEVALLAYDDATLEERAAAFERRAGVAEVVRAATAAGVGVLGVDLMFAEPEVLLDPALEADLRAWGEATSENSAESALLARVLAQIGGDEALAAAIDDADRVVLAFHLGAQGSLPAKDRSLAKGKYGQTVPGPYLPEEAGKVLASLPALQRRAAGLGLITTWQDQLGAVRDVPLAVGLEGSVFMPLAVALVARHRGVSRGELTYLGTEGAVLLGETPLVSSHNRRMLLNYRGPKAYPTYSVRDLLDGTLPADALAGKIAILGYTHLGSDAVQTPYGRQPGMVVHATAVDNLLRGDPLRRAAPWLDALWVLSTGIGVSLGFLARRPLSQVALAASALGLSVLTSLGVFALADLWIATATPLLTGLSAAAAGMGVAYFQEGKQRRTLRRSFAHYLSDALVEEMVADPSRVSLRGERRELSVLFSDIRSFTTFSERTEPEVLAGFLNAYFTPMTQAVLDNQGYVDKFIGDAVMALFGAPVSRAAHASHACQCALDMKMGLATVRPVAEKLGIELNIGVGINTGEMVVGNMGSATRFDYTVLGDAVNLASRIEGLTKQYGVFCLVGQATARAAPDFAFRPIDWVRVKGKGEPVELFELLGHSGEPSPYRALDRWDAAMSAWRAGDLGSARREFGAFSEENPGDPPCALFLARLAELGEYAPAGWDGVFTHTKK